MKLTRGAVKSRPVAACFIVFIPQQRCQSQKHDRIVFSVILYHAHHHFSIENRNFYVKKRNFCPSAGRLRVSVSRLLLLRYSGNATHMRSLPFLYSAVVLPPIFSVSDFAMDSPSPVPPRAVFTVKNRSKRCAVCTGSNSDALFSNVTVPSGDSRTDKSPSEYLTALERILSKIRRRQIW